MKIKRKRKENTLYKKLSYISPQTLKLLNLTLPFLLCAFIWFGVSYISAAFDDPISAEYIYRPVSENLLASLCILLGGAAILDRSIARGDFDK